MDYEFRISPYNDPSFVQQISCALEKRAESIPREKYEKMWKASVNISLYLQKIPVGVSTAYGNLFFLFEFDSCFICNYDYANWLL